MIFKEEDAFGKKLKEINQEKGYSIKKLCDLAKVSQQDYNKWLEG